MTKSRSLTPSQCSCFLQICEATNASHMLSEAEIQMLPIPRNDTLACRLEQNKLWVIRRELNPRPKELPFNIYYLEVTKDASDKVAFSVPIIREMASRKYRNGGINIPRFDGRNLMIGLASPSSLSAKFWGVLLDRRILILKWLIRLAAIYLFFEWSIWYLVFSASIEPEQLRLFEYVKGFGAGFAINIWLWISTVRLRLMWKWIVLVPILLMLVWYILLTVDKPTFGHVLGLIAYLLGIFILFKTNSSGDNCE